MHWKLFEYSGQFTKNDTFLKNAEYVSPHQSFSLNGILVCSVSCVSRPPLMPSLSDDGLLRYIRTCRYVNNDCNQHLGKKDKRASRSTAQVYL